MQLLKTSSNKKRPLLIGLILSILLVLVGIGIYVYAHQGFAPAADDSLTSKEALNEKDSTINLDKPTDEQSGDGATTKEDVVTGNTNSATLDPVTNKQVTTVTIPSAQKSGDTLRITTLIETVTSAGVCTITLTQAEKVVTKTANVQALSNSSTCQGFTFNVPTELNSGKWDIKLDYTSDTYIGSATGLVNL